ncbi:hypothetical protein Tco_0747631 [Tanacetum coccineum]|uniref:Uncharacterized protein n=1 Tax=Tanacetum coccineum TaxID=301880 RepID=A0ABQ4YTK3_9ASTR
MLKPIPEDDRSVTPKLVWVIPTSHIPDAEKDWANALATTYQAMAENSLLEKNGDIRTFMNCKGCGQALSISKMKAARYHDFRLELLIPEHMWIDDNKSLLSLRVRLLKDITLRRADNQEYMIAEKDFKNLYPSDFEDLNLLLLQGHLNHLPGSDIRMLSTAVKLNNERKIMRFNEIYMFSDGTLTNIMEALDHRVKEYKVNRLNPEHLSDTYVFTMKMEILLEPTSNKLMVGDSDVYTLEDPTLILEILSRRFFLRLNLPDHRSVQVKMEMEIPHSSGVYFITTCSYSTDTSNELLKAQMKSNFQDQANDRALWDVLKQWDVLEEEKVIDEDEVIPEDETHELITEFQHVDKRVPTIFDRARMEATLNDMMSNQFQNAKEYTYHLEQATNFMENQIVHKEFKNFIEDARLSIQHWKDSWHKRVYKQNQRKVKDNIEDYFSKHKITEVVKITTDQQYGLDYMEQILMMTENDKTDSFSKADFKYLNKNNIED